MKKMVAAAICGAMVMTSACGAKKSEGPKSSDCMIIAYTRNVEVDYSEFLGHSVVVTNAFVILKHIIGVYHQPVSHIVKALKDCRLVAVVFALVD